MVDGLQFQPNRNSQASAATRIVINNNNNNNVGVSPNYGNFNTGNNNYGPPAFPPFPPIPPIPPGFGNNYSTGNNYSNGNNYFNNGSGQYPQFPDFSQIFSQLPQYFGQQYQTGTNSPSTSTTSTPTNTVANPGTPGGANIVVVDQTDVSKSGIDLDGDNRPDVAHGTIVDKFISDGAPNARVSNVELPDYNPSSLVNAFNGLAQRADGGEKIDAVNFSAQTFDKISDIAQVTGLPLTRQNLAQYKDQIKARLTQIAQNPASAPAGVDPTLVSDVTKFVPVIQSLDGLTQRGIPVYIAAGNDGPDQFNLFALTNNAQVVGATDANGNKTSYTADNSLITRFSVGDNNITPVNGGVNFTGTGALDVANNQLTSGGGNLNTTRQVTGTSFASPRALADDLAGRTRFTA